jgi:hypothetical protein
MAKSKGISRGYGKNFVQNDKCNEHEKKIQFLVPII